MRDPQTVSVHQGTTLAVGGRTVLGAEFPMGNGWTKMTLRFNIAVTIGTGTGAIAESELLFIGNINLKSDKNEIFANMPARGLYKLATVKVGSPPAKTAMAAATATYTVDIPIYFVDLMGVRPYDTILDSARYNRVTLEVTLGTVADLFTTVGTSSVTCTLDSVIELIAGRLPEEARPLFHVSYDTAPPVDASSRTNIDLDRSIDLVYKRLLIHSSANSSAGKIYGGTNADDVFDTINLADNNRNIIQNYKASMLQRDNKNTFSLESLLAGYYVHDFTMDGSNNSALATGPLAKLQLSWVNLAGVAASDIVTCGFEALRRLRA